MSEKNYITQAELKRILHYCPETGVFTRKIRTANCVQVGDVAGSVDGNGYLLIQYKGIKYKTHRLAFLYMNGEWPENEVDHINHNKIDNRWNNLRLADRTKNNRNASQRKDNTSGVTGVSWHSRDSKWMASISHQKKLIHLGYFNCSTAAILARKAAEIKYEFHENHGK